ncbi:unnamed protein product [Spirodela intermedia]|uniref:Protein kinase domain-containing protein n=1 Tax=Spirodela intermedia TaxID=51605 RepID=A0A7I8JMT8_SPIIN|nr:unnamed protein product [Spirodela intermedia]CAA6671449.1 unnamed protein product [Spirodela intermedia]
MEEAAKIASLLYTTCIDFKYSTLEKATGHLSESNKLGQGGFGAVYKGVLADGREIAVKRLFIDKRPPVSDFFNEANIISSLEHENLVRLLGCSCSGPENLLVYEYLPNQRGPPATAPGKGRRLPLPPAPPFADDGAGERNPRARWSSSSSGSSIAAVSSALSSPGDEGFAGLCHERGEQK